MLYKGVLTIVALAALGSTLEMARSQSQDPLNSTAALMTKIDFDLAFADLDTTSAVSLESAYTKREMLRRAGMRRVIPTANDQKFVVLKTRMVDSNAALSLFTLDDTLYTSDLGQPAVCRVLANQETPMMNPEAPITTIQASGNELKSANVNP